MFSMVPSCSLNPTRFPTPAGSSLTHCWPSPPSSRGNPPPALNPQPYHFMSAKFTMSWHLPMGGINTALPQSPFSPHTYLVAESPVHRWSILAVSYLHRTSKVGTTPVVFGHLGC